MYYVLSRGKRLGYAAYERLLQWELSGTPDHVAVIMDGNRRYADRRARGTGRPQRRSQTTAALLNWCDELGIREVTLYTFSTENFDRDPEELEHIFDLVEQKLRTFADADRVHEAGVCIRAIGETEMLPERVRDAIDYAEGRTAQYDQLNLNIALAYGGRAELLGAARDVAAAVENETLDPTDVSAEKSTELCQHPTRDVDLIIRTGGAERTSNFLPWHANGNEAAVYFCAPYWPEFSKVDFLRALRTYQNREDSWRTTRAERSLALVRAIEQSELPTAKRMLGRFRDALPSTEREQLDEEYDLRLTSYRPNRRCRY
ncbi:di-trans,poly-cis-decaprenylcistransferase [Halogeometricum sp. wsp3]|nr:di-trans,poly-cis-decaprenylcistransferase [Halogeometricum sp. wsp3]